MNGLIIKTIKDAKVQVAEYGESIIDLFTENETWENVPFVSEAVKILTIRDIYHKNKIIRNYQAFIVAINKVDQKIIDNFLETLKEKEEEKLEDMMETIFDIIIDSHKPIKAQLLGNLLTSLACNKITEKDYNSLVLTIYSASVSALYALPDFLKKNHYTTYKSGTGAVENEGLLFSLGVATRYGNMFRLDDRGITLAKYGFKLDIK